MDKKTVPSRKNFLLRGVSWAAMVAAATLPFALRPKEKKVEKKTVKMLAQDGTLVEVDEALLTAHRKKITDAELKSWVNKK